jgi:carboxyl-terminal processing protease
VRVAAIGPNTASQVKSQIAELTKSGASKLVVDVRRASNGTIDEGLAIARLFVGKGTLAIKEAKGGARETIAAAAGDGAVTLPTVVLVDTGTSGASEVFASAMVGNQRADLIGEHTIGRAAAQKLVKLPDGAGLWLSTSRYLTPKGDPLHEKGLEPTVPVDDPDIEFGAPAPTTDPILEKAIERLSDKKAA